MSKTNSEATWLLYQDVCFKYWPNKNNTVKYGKFSIETVSENAWGQGTVKRTFKVINTEQVAKGVSLYLYSYVTTIIIIIQNDTRNITQLQYVDWSQQSCPDNCTPLINLIGVLESIQRTSNNGPITVHCR